MDIFAQFLLIFSGIVIGVAAMVIYSETSRLREERKDNADRFDYILKQQAEIFGMVSEDRMRITGLDKKVDDWVDRTTNRFGALNTAIDTVNGVSNLNRDNVRKAFDIMQNLETWTRDTLGEMDVRQQVALASVHTQQEALVQLDGQVGLEIARLEKILLDMQLQVDTLEARFTHRRRPRKANPIDGTENIVNEPVDDDLPY